MGHGCALVLPGSVASESAQGDASLVHPRSFGPEPSVLLFARDHLSRVAACHASSQERHPCLFVFRRVVLADRLVRVVAFRLTMALALALVISRLPLNAS